MKEPDKIEFLAAIVKEFEAHYKEGKLQVNRKE
jgi:hypothetical protein